MMAFTVQPVVPLALPAQPSAASRLSEAYQRARAGDPVAIQAVCGHLRPLLSRVAFAVVRDADEADDLAQEALIRVLKVRFGGLLSGRLEPWANRVVHRLALNRRRDVLRRRAILDAAGDHSPRPNAVRPADDIADAHAARRRIADAITRLPKRQREVLELRVFGALEYPDIASALGIKETAVRMSCSVGLRALKAELALQNDFGGSDAA